MNIVIYHTLLHQIHIAVKSRLKAISKRNAKKLTKFNNRQNKTERQEFRKKLYIISHRIRYPMMRWLLYLLVWIIKFRYVTIEVTLQLNLSIFIKIYLIASHIPEVQLSQAKTKLRDACAKYCRIKIPYKHSKTIENLSKRDDVIILKQDEGRGVVLMDKNKYTEKSMLFLNTK